MNEQRQRVVEEAKTWLLTPYHHKAAVKGAGVDCAQILLEVYYAAGLTDKRVDVGDYPMDWMMHRSEEQYLGWLYKYGHEVKEPLPGDVVIYKFGRCFSHAGIIIDWPTIIHSYRKEGGVVWGRGDKGEFEGREMKFISFWKDL